MGLFTRPSSEVCTHYGPPSLEIFCTHCNRKSRDFLLDSDPASIHLLNVKHLFTMNCSSTQVPVTPQNLGCNIFTETVVSSLNTFACSGLNHYPVKWAKDPTTWAGQNHRNKRSWRCEYSRNQKHDNCVLKSSLSFLRQLMERLHCI